MHENRIQRNNVYEYILIYHNETEYTPFVSIIASHSFILFILFTISLIKTGYYGTAGKKCYCISLADIYTNAISSLIIILTF